MSQIPAELKYVESHEWLRLETDGTVTVGITDHAQELLGDVVFVELPKVGATLARDEQAGVVESVKAASDVYSPIAGEVVAVNEGLEAEPEQANTAPYAEGWFFKIKPANVADLDGLMTAEAYAKEIGA
ncbi:glycine cleavage system protein GcvH [Crenobacter sp. SG2303]|uniref:Glycine cleavage system H protein n=1 Tax=Crenobacter oryzisoli TaxID=3056844 RepID=A0ABT7XNZ7_9NEIS|nr:MULTISPECIES: glycine cleavage system protein GcvH [unclassified Crenobacter]MDN0075524.1 glycine cleavage system protein GcvH [Crenobacter sp. SG2303]MDN0081422.1 glycine cleavage system protein GcvH [Crenobacter sp. SG2305]